MTQTQRQKSIKRNFKNRLRYVKLETVMFVTMLKFPRGTLISVSSIKERYRKALENEFREAQIVF